MKERPYNVREEEEYADRDMKEKCLDMNGESDVEKKNANSVDAGNKKLGAFSKCAKQLRTNNRICWIIALLCIVLLAFFIIIIALAVRVGWLERRTNWLQCDTAQCLGASSKIVSRWNTSFDPCQDFWTFSCGEWLHRNPLPSNKGAFGVVNQQEDSVQNHLRHLLDLVPHDASVRDAEWKAQRFYISCMNVEGVEQTAGSFKNKINEIGGWSILNNWSRERWERRTVIERLHVDFGVTPFFKLHIEPDDSTATKSIIKIVPDGLGLPNPKFYVLPSENKYETIYRTYMDEVARELGGTVEKSSEFAEVTFNFEKRLARVSPSLESYRDPISHEKKMTVQQLTSLVSTIPWLELLQKYFPSGNINYMTEIKIFNQTYFEWLSIIMSSSDDVVLHNYLMWQFTLAYAPHLSSSFRNIANHYYQFFEGVPNTKKKNSERWEYCLKVTSEYLGHALGSMYVKEYLVPESAKEAEHVKNEVHKAFRNYLSNIPWAEDYHTRTLIMEKMNTLSQVSGYPEFVLNSKALSDYYTELNVQSDFLENIKSGKYFLRRKMEASLISQDTPDDGWSIFPQDVLPTYHYNRNQLVIPAGLLHEPLFEPSAPLSIRFGSLGTHIASNMFKAFDDKGISYKKTGELDPWLSGESALRYQHKLECLMNKTKENAQDGMVNANLTVGELIADVAAVKFAYQAYQNLEREYNLPGIGRNHDQVFFIAYAQSMCENIRPEKVHLWADVSTTSPHQKRVVNTLKQLPEFAEAFGCSASSEMNPGGICHMW